MSLTANIRLYGATQTMADGTVALVHDVAFNGIHDAEPGREEGYIYAFVDLDSLDPSDETQQGSALDLHGTLDDYRALVENIQSFIRDNEEATS